MDYNVFISHSMNETDMPLIRDFCAHLTSHGITCYMAERDWKFGTLLAEKVEGAIHRADCVVAFLTEGGSASSYVNQEIGIARAKKKLTVPIVEKGVDLRGVQLGAEYLELNRDNPGECATHLNQYLLRLKAEKEKNNAIGWALLAFLAALAMR